MNPIVVFVLSRATLAFRITAIMTSSISKRSVTGRYDLKSLIGARAMTAALRSHIFGIVFLLPFLGMLTVHQVLNPSDHLLAAPDLGQESAQVYNYAMAYTFSVGVILYIASAVVNAPRSRTWFIAKLVLLGMFWTALAMFL